MNKEAKKQRDARGKDKQRAKFSGAFTPTFELTETMFLKLKEAPPNLFYDVSRTIAWLQKDQDLFMFVLAVGLGKVLARARFRAVQGPTGSKNNRAIQPTLSALRFAKAKAFSRIVERLDSQIVGDKPLGDCFRGDLLRAAVESETKAGQLTADAALFRQLAALIGAKSVRAFVDRGKVIALLTSTYSEDATTDMDLLQ